MALSAQAPLVLLVADGPQWREGLHLALVQEGYRVQQQPLPMRLQLLSPQADLVQPPDLLILNLPTQRWDLLNTVQLLERLRRRDLSTLLLMLPDEADEQARAALLDAGADDVLVRPFGLREFVARCRAMVRRTKRHELAQRAQDPTQVLRAGTLLLYRQECRVTLDGEEVNLTPREWKLLEYFMLHPGRAFSRDQLIEQVWGPDYCGDNKSVDVHVLWLRRKLEANARQPKRFVTVRGIGYRFDPPVDPPTDLAVDQPVA
jgi:two-component system phosphate regulon response regulator PhoB